jgi:Carboxypeptidase regulatory-like domain
MMALFFCFGLLLATVPPGAAGQAPLSYRISGIVVDAVTGAPVASAELSISEGPDQTKTTSGDDGQFVFQGVNTGKYQLSATARGYVREGFNQHGPYSSGIAVGVGLDSEHVIFRLHPQAVIAGRVTDEHGEAVRRAQVMLFSTESTTGRHARFVRAQMQTNDLGEYRFAGLQAGRYYVAVVARPWYAQTGLSEVPERGGSSSRLMGVRGKPDPSLDVVYPITFYPGVTAEPAVGELNLSAGEKEEADIHLQAVPAVHVRLTNMPMDVQSGIQIAANQKLFGSLDMGLRVVSGQITPGEYEVAGLPPGDVALVVNQRGNQEWNSRTIKANVSEGDTLNGGETGALVNVSGRVTFSVENARPEKEQITLVSEDNSSAYAKLRKDSTFSFAPLQEGTYKVFMNLSGSDEYVAKVSATGAKTFGREVTIAGAGDVQLSITMGHGRGQVTGVANVDGKATAGVMILLVPDSGQNLSEDSRLDQSDSDGTFALGRILPGKYLLLAIEDGWDIEWTNWTALKPYLEKGKTLQVSANEQKKVAVDVQHKMK